MELQECNHIIFKGISDYNYDISISHFQHFS